MLIVEDDQLLAAALSVQVEMLGYSVIGLADTASAAVAAALTDAPDIVIMDVNLGPGGSGLDAARSIRTHREVPIIFYTSYGDPAFKEQATTLANTQVLQKPVSDEALEQALTAMSLLVAS